MGDAADENIENGLDELMIHQAGDCEYGCPYCEEEAKTALLFKEKEE